MKILSIKFNNVIFYGIAFLTLFILNFQLPSDPDLGWHLRYGQEVVENKHILNNDAFTYTIRGQPMADAQWGIEALYYFLFVHWSFWGLAVFSSLIISLTFLIPVVFLRADVSTKFFVLFWSALGIYPLITMSGRPQNFSWLFFGLLLVLLIKCRDSRKVLYLLPIPLLFWLWANIHPGFFLGLFLYSLFVGLEVISSTVNFKRIIVFFLVFIVSFGLVRIRPLVTWQEGVSDVSFMKPLLLPVNLVGDDSPTAITRLTISEWLPPYLANWSGALFLFAIVISVSLFTLMPLTKKSLKDIVLLLFFIYFSTLSRRNAPFFFLVFTVVMLENLSFILPAIRSRKAYFLSFIPFLITLIVLVEVAPKNFSDIRKSEISVDYYCRRTKNPCEAMEFVRQKNLTGNLFNQYAWGGFLIWYYKDYPVFIDGRTPGGQVFEDYQKVVGLQDGWEEIVQKYNVRWFLLPPNPLFEEVIQMDGKWQEVYADDTAVIITRK